jgi:hypothetical protein
MDPDRVVDVRMSGTGDYGSGYLLTNRLVLTARHVVGEKNEGAACAVRPAASVADERPAHVTWVSASLDAALVEIDEGRAFGPAERALPLFGRRTDNSAWRYPCRAQGFPRAIRIDGLRGDWRLEGFASPSVRPGAFDISPSNAVPNSADGWKGFSGAAVFNGDLLMGVVESALEGFGGAVVRATPAAAMLEDPTFLARIAPGIAPARLWRELRSETYYAELGEQLRLLYCYIDRQPQVDQVTDALAPAIQGGKPAARGFLITGYDEDQPRLLIERLARHETVSRLVGDADVGRVIALLAWPRTRVLKDPVRHFEDLRRECSALLDREPLDAEAFAEALDKDYRKPLAIWWRLDWDQAGQGHAELLERWLAFCATASAGPTPLLWFVCVVLPSRPPAPPPMLKFLRSSGEITPDPNLEGVLDRGTNGGPLALLDPLPEIEPEADLDPWLALVARERKTLSFEDRRALRTRIEASLGDQVSLRLLPFTDRVNRSLKDTP